MRPEEFEDAKLLWKMFYAGQSFEHARAAAEYVLKENISADDSMLYPLMTAVYVLYGKPFKKSYGVGCLGEELIPVEYQELHRDLMKHRDKILAHSDASGFDWLDVGQANQVQQPGAITASGTATDNVGVAHVYYQINGGGWQPATTANAFANWSAANIPIVTGANTLQFYAADAAGNASKTNVIKITGL